MSTHGSAIALEETPHETETTQITISDALRCRALSVINDRRTDPQWRSIVRYALEINDPWLPDIVRRAGAGEKIIDSVDFSLEPQLNEDGSIEAHGGSVRPERTVQSQLVRRTDSAGSIPGHQRHHVANDIHS